jgi:hypothetical protein
MSFSTAFKKISLLLYFNGGTVDGKICFSTIFQKQWTPFSISLTGNACQQIPSNSFTSVVKLAIVNTFVQNVVY